MSAPQTAIRQNNKSETSKKICFSHPLPPSTTGFNRAAMFLKRTDSQMSAVQTSKNGTETNSSDANSVVPAPLSPKEILKKLTRRLGSGTGLIPKTKRPFRYSKPNIESGGGGRAGGSAAWLKDCHSVSVNQLCAIMPADGTSFVP